MSDDIEFVHHWFAEVQDNDQEFPEKKIEVGGTPVLEVTVPA